MNRVLVDWAEQSLRAFDVESRAEAERALLAWPKVAALTAAEKAEVLGRFDPVDWPESIHARRNPLSETQAVAERAAALGGSRG